MEVIQTRFDPGAIEKKWQARWDEAKAFRAGARPAAPPFSIAIPPPNVTGALHMGHALNNTLQDVYARWRRMEGDDVLWLPGTDHAGIATQNVVERMLAKEGTTREALGREKFLERVWKWKAESGGTIVGQLRRLGCSCDWSRERFTMDEGLSRAVREVFVRLYEEDLLYKGERLVNWCPRCGTALSDIEVEHEEVEGAFYHVRYPFADGSSGDGIVIATTRPETMLGDTAIAVHPEDERYRAIVGRRVRIPCHGREIPVIADARVEREFGTGALKITPAHDPADEAIGRDHKLPAIKAFTAAGRIAESIREGIRHGEPAEAYTGLLIADCRKVIVGDLEEAGFLVRTEPMRHDVGHCYRCRARVEPFLTPQWYVRAKPLAEKAAAAVREGKTKIVPAFWEKTYFHWMENIRDWCVSRQIWWGHRIPAWYCLACDASRERPVVAREAPAKCARCGGGMIQDEDVLDTWFSSGLWPFSTLGWPDRTEDLARWYPTSVLVTGFDILFFWVARMMMFGLHFMDGEVPFRVVNLHGLVRDPEGKKMSKMKGNVIDPLSMMDEYGADAFRFALCAMTGQGRDLKLDPKRIEGYRNFATKVWNATRLVLATPASAGSGTPGPEDAWVRSRLDETVASVRSSFGTHQIDAAAQAIYGFFWGDFCDWYLEIAKPRLHAGDAEAIGTGREVLSTAAALLHPFMPHLSEELHERLGGEGLLALGPYPSARGVEAPKEAKGIAAMVRAVGLVRSLRAEYRVAPGAKIRLAVVARGETACMLFGLKDRIARLAGAEEVEILADRPSIAGSAYATEGDIETVMPLAGLVDLAAERKRLEKELAEAEKGSAGLERKLADESFTSRAPEEIVAGTREELSARRSRAERIRAALASL